MSQLPAYLLQSRLARAGMSATIGALSRGSLPPHVSIAGNQFGLIDAAGARVELENPSVLVAGVVYVSPQHIRLYYKDPFTDGKDKAAPTPLCVSYGAVVPHETAKEPQAERCNACEWSKYGSAREGTGAGQACSERHPIVVVPEGSDKPYYLHIPPASLGAWADYKAWLEHAAREQKLPADLDLLPLVRTEFSFVRGKNGFLQFRAVGFLPEAQLRVNEALDPAEVASMVGPPQDYAPVSTLPRLAAPSSMSVPQLAQSAPADPPEAPKKRVVKPKPAPEPEPPALFPQTNVPDILGLGTLAQATSVPGSGSSLFGGTPMPAEEPGNEYTGEVEDVADPAPADSIEAMMSRALGIG